MLSVQELERSVALTDIDIAKLRADRDAAVEAKSALAAEYDRAMKQQRECRQRSAARR